MPPCKSRRTLSFRVAFFLSVISFLYLAPVVFSGGNDTSALSAPTGTDDPTTIVQSSEEFDSDDRLPVECEADVVSFETEHQKVIGTGHVVVTYEKFRLTCDYVEVYLETKDVFATGNVILYEGENVYRSEEVRYNFETRKGTLKNGEVASPPLTYVAGERAEKAGDQEFSVEEGYLTTCDFAIPHYRINSSSIDIYWDDKIVARNSEFVLGNMPIAWLPYYVHYFHRPSVIITPGKHPDFGLFVLTAWGFDINENLSGRINLDYRERLGVGEGVDLDYRTPMLGAGRLETYYTHERSRNFDQGIKAEDERWRVKLRHLWLVDDETTVNIEYFEQSDENFTQDYFEDEFQVEGNPESFVSLTSVQDGYKFFTKIKKRANRYESLSESLPEIKVDISPKPVFTENLIYSSTNRFENFNSKAVSTVESSTPRPNTSTTSDTDVVQASTFHELTYAHRLFRWLDVSPNVNYQADWWSKEAPHGHDNIHRTKFGTGIGVSTRFYRIFDVRSNFLGMEINRLRHLVVPSFSYSYNRRPSVGSRRLITSGSAGSNSFSLGLGNILQTKRYQETQITEEGDLKSLGAGVEDTGEIKSLKQLVNVNLADLAISADYTINPEGGISKFSAITGNLELRPYPWLTSEMETSYDHIEDRFSRYQFDVVANRGPLWAGLGYEYQVKSSQDFTTEWKYQVSPLWNTRLFWRYDYRNSKMLEQEYALERELHDFTVSFNYNIAESETIWIKVSPNAFPDMQLFEFSTGYHEPKQGRNF